MFLYNKRTRKVIKYFWGFFAILIIISMVITYSGFSRIRNQQTAQQSTQKTPTTEEPIVTPVSNNTAVLSTKEGTSTFSVQPQKPTQKLQF